MDPVAENYQLKWHSFSSHLHSCVASSVSNESFADVSLFTIDGHRIQAHRFILSACSQYLHQVLKYHQKTSTTLPIIIVLPPEINYKTMKTLIQYMYSGETTVSKDILESVLRGGDILKVRGLWRPREDEESNRKLVKLHQKYEPPKTTAEPKPNKQVLGPQPAETPPKPEENKESGAKAEGMPFLVIKEEPLEWSEVAEGEMELVDESEVFRTEMTIKPEVLMESEGNEEELYSPLTCELCTETFMIPADWVKHIQTHTDMLPAKRQRRGQSSSEEDNATFPPLQCDLCQKYFPTPAEWVHHVQNTHTELELRQSNRRVSLSSGNTRSAKLTRQNGSPLKMCAVCNKKFPSHASMLIHKRTHTGERPYACEFCCKGFNVKSNLLRHLRTLHDKIVNPTEVDCNKEEEAPAKNEEVTN